MAIGSVFFCCIPLETRAQEQPVPTAPTNLVVSALKKGVKLSWNNVNAPAVSEFIVYRLENYSPDTTLRTVAAVPRDPKAKSVSYNDMTTEYAHTYTYFVTSKTEFGVQSANSKYVPVTTPTAQAAGVMQR